VSIAYRSCDNSNAAECAMVNLDQFPFSTRTILGKEHFRIGLVRRVLERPKGMTFKRAHTCSSSSQNALLTRFRVWAHVSIIT